jgi:4-hydroxybenzoate polyprenyltransferase
MISLPTVAPRPLARYLGCIRYRELFLLQGTPLFGVAFAVGALTPRTMLEILLFAIAGFLLLAHTFTFNDWAEFVADLKDRDKAATLAARDVSRPELALLSVGLLLPALLLFGLLSWRTLLLAIVLAGLGVLYSHPAIHAKGLPVVSSALHLIAGVLHFLLGYSLYGPIDGRGTMVGLYFALTFTAGHLNQEVRDYEGDRLNGIRTNAVTFSKGAIFFAGLVLFTVAYGYLVVLARSGLLPGWLAWLGLLYAIHLAWSVRVWRTGLTFEGMSRFRDAYRALYAVIGLAMLAAVLAR